MWSNNVWTFRQPFDIEFWFDSSSNGLRTNGLQQNEFGRYVHASPDWLAGEFPVIQLNWGALFWTNEKNVWIEQLPNSTTSRIGLELIPASFPISVWTRPVITAFKILDFDKKIFLSRGTPLCNIRLHSTKPSEKFSLEQSKPSEKVLDNLYRDGEVKNWQKFFSWTLINKRLDKEESKCPFAKLWKK